MTGQQNKDHCVRGITILVWVHATVSLFLWIVSMAYLWKRGFVQYRPLLLFSVCVWSVSLLLCIGMLVYLHYYWKFDQQAQQTPCPFQLSFPSTILGRDTQERDDIRSVLEWMSLPYNKQSIYILMTGYDLKKICLLASPRLSETQQTRFHHLSSFKNIPIGCVLDGTITDLRGNRVWPPIL